MLYSTFILWASDRTTGPVSMPSNIGHNLISDSNSPCTWNWPQNSNGLWRCETCEQVSHQNENAHKTSPQCAVEARKQTKSVHWKLSWVSSWTLSSYILYISSSYSKWQWLISLKQMWQLDFRPSAIWICNFSLLGDPLFYFHHECSTQHFACFYHVCMLFTLPAATSQRFTL